MQPKKLTVAIDPEVLWEAADSGDSDCQKALLEIHDNKSCFDLIFGNSELDKHYENFIRSQAKKPRNRSQWIANLINTLRNRYPTRNCPTPDEAPEEVRNCTTPHRCPTEEQRLLRIAVEMEKHSTTTPRIILLMRCMMDSNTRCLYKPDVQSCLKRRIPGLEIFCPKRNGGTLLALYKVPTNRTQHVNSFELQTGEIIACRYGCSRKIPKKVRGEQVDFYYSQKAGNPRMICVGECKLRFTDEKKKIESADIDQLGKKIKAVKEYEQERQNVEGGFEIISFIETNADGMEEAAWKQAQKLGVKFTMFRVRMPTNWEDDPFWRISEDNLEEISCPVNLRQKID